MNSIINDLAPVEKNKAYLALNRVVDLMIKIQIKVKDDQRVYNCYLKKMNSRRHFYITEAPALAPNSEITIKIIVDERLFFLKTTIKKSEGYFYFDEFDNFFELIRRKKPRFRIPKKWKQSGHIQSLATPYELKSGVEIIEMSKAGMKLRVQPELPRYEDDMEIKIAFKVFRRAEISLKAKIVHLKKSRDGGPVIGIKFSNVDTITQDKIQNVCDDLAFFHASESGVL